MGVLPKMRGNMHLLYQVIYFKEKSTCSMVHFDQGIGLLKVIRHSLAMVGKLYVHSQISGPSIPPCHMLYWLLRDIVDTIISIMPLLWLRGLATTLLPIVRLCPIL